MHKGVWGGLGVLLVSWKMQTFFVASQVSKSNVSSSSVQATSG